MNEISTKNLFNTVRVVDLTRLHQLHCGDDYYGYHDKNIMDAIYEYLLYEYSKQCTAGLSFYLINGIRRQTSVDELSTEFYINGNMFDLIYGYSTDDNTVCNRSLEVYFRSAYIDKQIFDLEKETNDMVEYVLRRM